MHFRAEPWQHRLTTDQSDGIGFCRKQFLLQRKVGSLGPAQYQRHRNVWQTNDPTDIFVFKTSSQNQSSRHLLSLSTPKGRQVHWGSSPMYCLSKRSSPSSSSLLSLGPPQVCVPPSALCRIRISSKKGGGKRGPAQAGHRPRGSGAAAGAETKPHPRPENGPLPQRCPPQQKAQLCLFSSS